MKISILTFGIAKDIIGGSSLDLEVEEMISVKDLKVLLSKKYPAFKSLRSFAIAVNNEYGDETTNIRENDEIALIPPVSGG